MTRMPVLFVGHGSPMNAIEDNRFSRDWKEITRKLPQPKAILCVSAHWFTAGTRVMDNAQPRMIYDMYGFPRELYEVVYPSPGAPELASRSADLLGGAARLDGSWGYDHGAWSVLHVMYPKADIPVFELSVDRASTPEGQYEVGKRLAALRDEGVLILGSGNVVHHLGRVDFGKSDGYGWAYEFDDYIHDAIISHRHDAVVRYELAGECARLAFPTTDHFYPLLVVLGAASEGDPAVVFNRECVMGSMSMTSYLLG